MAAEGEGGANNHKAADHHFIVSGVGRQKKEDEEYDEDETMVIMNPFWVRTPLDQDKHNAL